MGSATRRILLVDCDQFFVQCARLADPRGAGREALLLVGGSATHRGVVTSASYETRAFGVRSGMPTSRALRLCPRAVVAPVPLALCREKSAAVREVLAGFTPRVEPASVDEAYLDLSGTERLYHGEALADTARRIQAEVLRETRIHVSLGGGASKLVAKLAVSRAKPAGVHVVPPGGEEAFMRQHELADIPGVGPVSAAELKRFGLVRVEDALRLDADALHTLLGERRGTWLHRRIRGIDDTPVETEHTARSMSRDETFARDLHEDAELLRELRHLVRRLGRDLREDGLSARTVTARVRDHDFRTRQAARTLPEPVQTDGALYQVGRDLLARLRSERHVPARLLGITASNLVPGGGSEQLALFEGEGPALENDRQRTLARVTDALRSRYGGDVIGPADLLEP